MRSETNFSQITIVGLGLMGGSFGLAVKDFYPATKVVGVDFQKQLKIALRRETLDKAYQPEDLKESIDGSDLVVLATPVDQVLQNVKKLSDLVERGTVVMDLGSTKLEICRTGWDYFDRSQGSFIGGHPMTGAEIKGMAGAHPLLYENSVFVLCTRDGQPTASSKKLASFLTGLGTEPRHLSPFSHDRIVARISHLPQIVSIGLMKAVQEETGIGETQIDCDYLQFAGGGFKDMTRIASSPFDVWSDIFSTNGELISDEIDRFVDIMEDLRELVGNVEMEEKFVEVSELRKNLPASTKGISSQTFKVAVMIPDKPGALAELTSIIADEGINLKDLELQKVREDYGGTFHLYFETQSEAEKANKIMLNSGFQARVIE